MLRQATLRLASRASQSALVSRVRAPCQPFTRGIKGIAKEDEPPTPERSEVERVIGMSLPEPPSAAKRLQQYPTLYAQSSQLVALKDEDQGRWFEITDEALAKVPMVLKETLLEPLEMGGQYLMLRNASYDVLSALQEIQRGDAESAAGSSVGVYGPRGGGKTVLMNKLALFAVQQEWLLLGSIGEEFPKDMHGWITPSTEKPGVFEQRRNSVAYFKDLMEKQGYLLKSIMLKQKYGYKWIDPLVATNDITTQADLDAIVDHPTTLHGLLEQATLNTDIAGLIMYDFVEEIKLATEVKTLVLVDNFNVWDQDSQFRRPDNPFKKIKNRELSMVDAFMGFYKGQGIKNGLSVFAMTSHATQNMGLKHLKECTFTIKQEVYSDEELKNAVLHYKVSKLIFAEVDPFLLARIKGLHGGVPKDTFFDAALI